MTEKNIETKETILELLKDKDTYIVLKEMGYLRDKIHHLHHVIDNLEREISKIEMEIADKHGLDLPNMIKLSIIAQGVFENEYKGVRADEKL